jgi:ABC-type phosphate/phosphonate transport system ATPase subunit
VPSLSAQLNAVMGCAPEFTVRDWIGLPLGRVPAARRSRLADLAVRHGVADLLTYRVGQLSGGQRQRVAFVRAVLGAPNLLLADEPTTGLDPVAVAHVVDDLLSPHSSTVLVSTHDLGVARRFPRIIGLRDGRVVHDGPEISVAQADSLYAEATTR